MRGWVSSLVFFAVLLGQSYALQARELVLVCRSQESTNVFSKTELRRLFLGFPVKKNNTLVNALRNTSENDVYQVFLQNVMFMSERNYERRLLSLNFTRGNKVVPEYEDTLLLIRNIKKKSNNVSYVWRDNLDESQGLTVIQVLWEGD